MPYSLHPTNSFKKGLKLAAKRGKDVKKIEIIVKQLQSGTSLAKKHQDHNLFGNYTGYRECHIEPDWLLIYRIEIKENILILEATGSHSDLFR